MSKPSCSRFFRRILIVVAVFGVVIPLTLQIILLLTHQSNLKDDTMIQSHNILYVDLDLKKSQVEGLTAQMTELEAIRIKAVHSLSKLDEQRTNLLTSLKELQSKKLEYEASIARYSKKVAKYKKEVEYLETVQQKKVVTNVVYVGLPKHPIVTERDSYQKERTFVDDNTHALNGTNIACTYDSCFDYSRCSILNGFRIDIQRPEQKVNLPIYQHFKNILKLPTSKHKSCASLSIIDSKTFYDKPKHVFENKVNHIIYVNNNYEHNYCSLVHKLTLTTNILVMSKLCPTIRMDYDFFVPLLDLNNSKITWKELPMLLPIKREYLLYFYSEFVQSNNNPNIHYPNIHESKEYNFVIKNTIEELNNTKSADIFLKTKCRSTKPQTSSFDWFNCEQGETRSNRLKQSIFTIVIVDYKNPYFFNDIIESFICGTVPVLIGQLNLLPYKDMINWKLISVLLPHQRLPELLYTLRTLSIRTIFNLKSQGRFIYQSYFNTPLHVLKTVIAVFKNRINLPPDYYTATAAVMLFNQTNAQSNSNEDTLHRSNLVSDLNSTYLGLHSYHSWNTYPGALQAYPVHTWVDPSPTRLQFLNEANNLYMPIGDGKGGDGAAFSRSLGGDYPSEQFTIIMLTYDRNAILMEALLRLSGMKYLHKVIVVWNNPVAPSKELSWPKIGVSIEVVRGERNSLNNRFIPYDNIETEAVLSMDDDIYLRHDEIELAFRVWRENRDRIVGFPGRHHAYNSTSDSFYYNSEHSCELSLVLTGGAFFHKYYAYVYTHKLNDAVKQMVDDFMNCEDIAMNFLVSHITQKPPVKVTSRWTFRCPGCPVALSADDNHYVERNTCIGFFEKVFGYNPLKRTQYRADSILFKTRLPSTITKCFQYV